MTAPKVQTGLALAFEAYPRDQAETDQVRVHLQACAECREELDRFSAVAGLIGAGDLEAPPPQLRDAMLEAAKAMS